MDLVYVSYNSKKWIDNCFASVAAQKNVDLKKLNIYVVDNASVDGSFEILQNAANKYCNVFGNFVVVNAGKNLGFGKANNLGFRKGASDIVCFFNIDTELFPDALAQLAQDIQNSTSETALWELRQFPYEHPKLYNALTHETTWSSGAAFAMRRDAFEKLGGFDERIFMYAEDVDLSWRARSFGYKLKYVPKAMIHHYSYQSAGEVKPNQYLNSLVNNLLLRYRFGTWRDVANGHALLLHQLTVSEPFPGAKKQLLKKYLQSFSQIPHFRDKRKIGTDKDFQPLFIGFDYAPIRDGAFYVNEPPQAQPLVSIIVRTCGRPDVLRETLMSLRAQTYPNIEIVVVEDGKPVSRKMIEEEFDDLRVLYRATGEKVGRSAAGNLAMGLAHGAYLNLLDDDDLFYADHVEILVRALEKSDKRAAYAFAFETPIVVESKSPYIYHITNYLGIHKQDFDRIILCYHNYIPIQCIMFEKSLFDEHGGFDETLDALEDWDMWVRYSQYTDFVCVKKTTSIYRVPADRKIDAKRQKELDDALVVVRNKHKGYKQTISVYDIAMMYKEFAHL